MDRHSHCLFIQFSIINHKSEFLLPTSVRLFGYYQNWAIPRRITFLYNSLLQQLLDLLIHLLLRLQ